MLMFSALTLINVVLSTIKSLLLAKSDNKAVNSLANGIYYGFYTIILKQMVSQPSHIAISVTIGANLIGVYLSLVLMEKMQKDKLWNIAATIEGDGQGLIAQLREENLSFFYNKGRNKEIPMTKIDIYAYSKAESSAVKDILKQHKVKTSYNQIKLF